MNNISLNSDTKLADVARVWRDDHCLKWNSSRHYLQWIRLFRSYCREQGLDEISQLTLKGATTFAKWYAQRHDIDEVNAFQNVRNSLHAWACARRALNDAVPEWTPAPDPKPLAPPLLEEFAAHLREHRGNPMVTITKKIKHIANFLKFLQSRRCVPEQVKLTDIDAYVIDCRSHFARTTTADICSSIRGFLRFLLATGRMSAELASSVMSPVVRSGERPLRALPWDDVRRILRAVDRRTKCGNRDYAMLLMMSTYGLGAGEVIGLTLDDIDWRATTLHVVRPKTRVEFMLPLLPAVSRALAAYLQRGRPGHAPTRHLFLSMSMPHHPLSSSSAVRHLIVKYARLAGVSAPFLGSHVLRHTHACRQMELGAPPQILGDILGHRDPASISAYVRIASERLREISLPVPT